MGNRWRFLYRMGTEDAGTRVQAASRDWEDRYKRRHGAGVNPCVKEPAVTWSEEGVAKRGEHPSRKAAIVSHVPVPQTDTGGQGEDPEADGRSVVKELGKMAP